MPKLSSLVILSLSAALLMLGVGMIVVLLPQRVHAMTGTLGSVGLVASIFALAYLLAQPLIGALADRLGSKRFLVVGYALCSVAGIVFFATETAGGIYVGRAVQGLGEAPIWALGPAILSLAYPATKGRAIGIYNAAIHIGLTLGPLMGLLIAPDGQGRLPFLVFAGLCLAAGSLVLLFGPSASANLSHAKPTWGQFVAVLRRKTTTVLLIGVLLYGAGYGIFLTVLPVSLAATHGFDATAMSMLVVLFYAAISFSQIIAGVLSDRIGRHGFLVGGMALAAAGMASFPFVTGLGAYLPLGLASVGLGIFCIASITDLNDSVPDSLKGAISGCYYAFWGAGYVLGPLIIGAVGTTAPSVGFIALALAFGLQSLALRVLRA